MPVYCRMPGIRIQLIPLLNVYLSKQYICIMTKKILYPVFLVLLPLFAISCSDDDDATAINFDDLPEQAQTFIDTYFPGASIQNVQSNPFGYGGYEVDFINGAEVDFDNEGNWTSVEAAYGSAVPDGIVPLSILSYMDINFPSQYITEIEQNVWGYHVETSADLELVFDQSGNFLRYD